MAAMLPRKPFFSHPLAILFPPERDIAWLFVFSILIFVARVCYIVFISPYGLAPDEAQYWTWLTHLDWSFLTKPPLTTWLIGLSTAVLGDTLLGVKFFALLSQILVPVLGFALAQYAAQPPHTRTAGWLAWSLLTTLPILSIGGLLMSPDAILLPFWLGAVLTVSRAVRPGLPEAKALYWGRWITVGVLVGLGGLAKYSAALFYPLLMLWVALWRPTWYGNLRAWTVIGSSGIIALLFQIPVFHWNIQNQAAGAQHVVWQTTGGGDSRHAFLSNLGEFAGSQFVVLGPVIWLLLLLAWGIFLLRKKNWNSSPTFPVVSLLFIMSLPIMALFTALTISGKVQANWPVLGTVTGIIFLATWLAHAPRFVTYTALGGMGINLLLGTLMLDTFFFRDHHLFPVAARHDPTKDLRGWPEMGDLLSILIRRLDNPIILSTRYQTLAPLAFHTSPNIREGLDVAYINTDGRRANHYDLWENPPMHNRIVLYVNESGALPDGLKTVFKSCELWHTAAVESRDIVTRHLSLWLCWGARTPSQSVPATATP